MFTARTKGFLINVADCFKLSSKSMLQCRLNDSQVIKAIKSYLIPCIIDLLL